MVDKKKKIRKRPRRIYKNKSGFFYITKSGKKVYIKMPSKKKMSQKQVVKINIKNIVPVPTYKARRRRKVPRVSKRIDRALLGVKKDGLTAFTISPIDRRLKNIEEQKKDIELAKNKIDRAIYHTNLEKLFSLLKDKVKGSTAFVDDDTIESIDSPAKGRKVNMNIRVFKKNVIDFLTVNPYGTYIEFINNVLKVPSIVRKYDIDRFSKETGKNYTRYLNVYLKIQEDIIQKEEADSDEYLSFVKKRKSRAIGEEEEEKEEEKEEEIKGSGLETGGLWNIDLEKLLKKKIKNYIPVVSFDETESLHELVSARDKEFGFIVNTNPSTSDGTGTDGYRVGHWTCCFISGLDYSIEYFDPLSMSDTMPKTLLNSCKKIAQKMNKNHMFKVKVNYLQRQENSSDTCGLHCIQFLSDRISGLSFSEASGYDSFLKKTQANDGEEGEKYIQSHFQDFKKYV